MLPAIALQPTAAFSSVQKYIPKAVHKDWTKVGSCYSRGAFRLQGKYPGRAEIHFLDKKIADIIWRVAGNSTLLDVGAGSGRYGAYFHKRRMQGELINGSSPPLWKGVDGSVNVAEFTRRSDAPLGAQTDYLNVCNLTSWRPPSHDYVMSLEVGEHIPPRCMRHYLSLLHLGNRRGLFLSWAIPGRAGKCHIAARPNVVVIAAMRLLGYISVMELADEARNNAQYPWFNESFMVFRRSDVQLCQGLDEDEERLDRAAACIAADDGARTGGACECRTAARKGKAKGGGRNSGPWSLALAT